MEESFQTRLAAIQQAAEALSEHLIRRIEAEDELRKSMEELRALAARLQRVREEERASLARAIHDELSGALTALNMELSLLPSRVTQDLHQLLTHNTASMSEHIHHMLERVRIIATELRPAVLDQLGLIAAVEWELQQFQRRSALRCEIILPDGEIPLDRERSTAVFRIFQEALTNVALHAHASQVTINIKKENESLILETAPAISRNTSARSLISPRASAPKKSCKRRK